MNLAEELALKYAPDRIMESHGQKFNEGAPGYRIYIKRAVNEALERAAQEADQRRAVRECTECDDAEEIAAAIRKLKGE